MISLRKQRGYLYLSTGANGAGKTLFTLEDVRKLQLETNRPVFFKGFTAKRPLLDFGWIEHDMKDWQSLPDGSICVWDECQEDITSQTADKALDYERKILSEHRKRGFDFFFITQHPMNMGAFIRRTVAAPGWHRHFKASSIALNSNELKWSTVNTQPEKPNSGASGTVVSRTHNKEVYDWYTSTVGDTAQRKIPARVWYAIAAVVFAIIFLIAAGFWFKKSVSGLAPDKPAQGDKVVPQNAPKSNALAADRKTVMTTAEYAESFQPRIAGLSYTASRYDGLTAPKQAPKPAACLDGIKRGSKQRTCECWTQQATRMDVPKDVCQQIAAGGFFDDSLDAVVRSAATPSPAAAGQPAQLPPAVVAATVPPLTQPEVYNTAMRDGETLKDMRKRENVK
jgi:zona occludens toxin